MNFLLLACYWLIAVDGSAISALLICAAIQSADPLSALSYHKLVPPGWYAAALYVATAIVIGLSVAVTIFDLVHPGVQFPIFWRIFISIPAICLANYGLWPAFVGTWRIEGHRLRLARQKLITEHARSQSGPSGG